MRYLFFIHDTSGNRKIYIYLFMCAKHRNSKYKVKTKAMIAMGRDKGQGARKMETGQKA